MKNILFYGLLSLTITMSAQRNRLKNIYSENGKIGIGTNTPDELLTVKGKIHTQEVIVDLNGAIAPDFVFEKYYNSVSVLNPAYEFSTLYEIETYIKKNHHLPKIPSAPISNSSCTALTFSTAANSSSILIGFSI